MNITKHEPDPSCPRCVWADVEYCFVGESKPPKGDPIAQHIKLTCTRCGFVWAMKVDQNRPDSYPG